MVQKARSYQKSATKEMGNSWSLLISFSFKINGLKKDMKAKK